MELTADLVRERLWKHPELDLLRATGIQIMLAYTPTELRLQVGDRIGVRLDWIAWWEPELDTREDHAAAVAHQLVAEWKQNRGEAMPPDP